MENASSHINTSAHRGQSFRKLRWKNYLNHLLHLLLFCVNVPVDGRIHSGDGAAAVNFYHKNISTPISGAARFTFRNESFKPPSESNVKSNEKFILADEFSNFNRSDSHFTSHDDNFAVDSASNSNVNASNNSSFNGKHFHLIKSKPERNNSINPIKWDRSSVPSEHIDSHRIIKPENIVNTTRITNYAGDVENIRRVKKSQNFTGEGENKLSIDYNQSSYRSSRQPQNHGNQKARDKAKSVTKAPRTEKNSTKSRAARKPSKVSLLGLFEMTTHLGARWEGKSELAAAELAVKHINERGLLPGYTLELITNDTQVTKRQGVGARLHPLHQFLNLI